MPRKPTNNNETGETNSLRLENSNRGNKETTNLGNSGNENSG